MSDSEEIVLSQLPKPQNGSLEIKDETEEAPLALLNGLPKKKRKSTSKENGSSSKKKKTSKKKQKTTKVKEDPEIKLETTDVEPVAKVWRGPRQMANLGTQWCHFPSTL